MFLWIELDCRRAERLNHVFPGSTPYVSDIIAVSDSGDGLDDQDLADLREFVPGRSSKKNRGTGFGLPIARRYVVAHGGSLAIDSEVGEGTTLTVSLPLEQEEAEFG